MVGAASAVFPH